MELPLEFILSLWSRIFYVVQDEIYKSKIIFPTLRSAVIFSILRRAVFLCCLCDSPVNLLRNPTWNCGLLGGCRQDPPHNPTWNCRLLGGYRQDPHKLLVWFTSRGLRLTTLQGHPVHVGCLEGAIRRNKTTQVQFGIMTPPLVGPAILPFPAAI